MTDVSVQAPPTREALYAEIQQFYAHHLQLLDDGKAEEWAATFTVDGVFAPEHHPNPVTGRAALTEGARRSHAELAKTGEVRRHWHGMVSIEDVGSDGSVKVRCYALIFGTRPGAEPTLVMTCVCEDVLVREEGQLLVSHRRVVRDGVVAGTAPTHA